MSSTPQTFRDSLWTGSFWFALIALLLLWVSIVYAVGVWSLTDYTGCNAGSGDDKCIDTTGTASTDYVNIYYREANGARFCEKTVDAATDFGAVASPYAMVGDCGLGDWPAVDFQVLVHEQANVCDGFDIEACLDVSGIVVGICASYPGGVYAQFTLQDCIVSDTEPPAEEYATSTVWLGDLYATFMTQALTMFIVLAMFLSVGFILMKKLL